MEKNEPKPTSTLIMHNIPLTFDEHEVINFFFYSEIINFEIYF